MSDLNAQDIEIIGFNGAPLVECGRAFPIARRKSNQAHAVLDFSNGATALNWHSEGEADALLASGRWTKFVMPVLVPQGCCDHDNVTVQPMVIYADQSMLSDADRLPCPPMPSGEYIIWRQLESHPETIRAGCAAAGTVESLLDDWATALLKRFDAMFRIGRDQAYLERIADFALCAARDRNLRWKAYSYLATVQESDRVQRTFETFIQREFPDATWDQFMGHVKGLRDVLSHAPPINTTPGPSSSPSSTARPKMENMTQEDPISEDELFAL